MAEGSLSGDLLILFSIPLIRFLILALFPPVPTSGGARSRFARFVRRLYGALKPLLMGL